jgi:hypothetical protein
MADKSKAENATTLQAAGIPRKSFSEKELCARHGISPGLLRQLEKRGLGPRWTYLLRRKIITEEDEATWLRERAAASAMATST